jgi:hypothetical protein
MFGAGLALIFFGLALAFANTIMAKLANKYLTVTGTIVGYKQFPADKTITDAAILKRGIHFRWLRVFQFQHPQTGQIIELFGNPAVWNPEPVGTQMQLGFNPAKINPVTDFVWVKQSDPVTQTVVHASVIAGLLLVVGSFFIPSDSFANFPFVVAAMLAVFLAGFLRISRT